MFYAIMAVLVLAADFVSKTVVMHSMSIGEKIEFIPRIISFTYIRNKGIAWGMFENARLLFIILTIAIIAVLCIVLAKKKVTHPTGKAAVYLVLSGALGNLIDRIFYPDGVVDFICTEFMDFPIFNIADMAVCIGAALLIVYVIFFDAEKKDGDK